MTFRPGSLVVAYNEGTVLAAGRITSIRGREIRIRDIATGQVIPVFNSEVTSWQAWGEALASGDATYVVAMFVYLGQQTPAEVRG
jgi:hypothetical protein